MTESPPQRPRGKALSVRGATVLGVGSMVGAGIFALLGEAGAVAGAAVWISFLIGGIVAGLLGYVCSKLGMRFPSSGGLITYLEKGFGLGRVLGITSWLGYIAAVVVVTAMVAVSFGGYAVSLFIGDDGWSGWDNVFISALLVAMCALNMVGRKRSRRRRRRSSSACSPSSACSSSARSRTSTRPARRSTTTRPPRRSSRASR